MKYLKFHYEGDMELVDVRTQYFTPDNGKLKLVHGKII